MPHPKFPTHFLSRIAFCLPLRVSFSMSIFPFPLPLLSINLSWLQNSLSLLPPRAVLNVMRHIDPLKINSWSFGRSSPVSALDGMRTMCNLYEGAPDNRGFVGVFVCLFSFFSHIEVSMLCWFQVYKVDSVAYAYTCNYSFFKFISQLT